MSTNPLNGFLVDPSGIKTIGTDLQRPECILAERNGTLWSADARGGVMRISPDGSQQLISQKSDVHFTHTTDLKEKFTQGTLPNGLAFAENGDILISNFGTDVLEVMTRDGTTKLLYDTIDGSPIGKVNFVLRDSKNRIWITISTRIKNWMEAIEPTLADGYIALVDEKGIRIVADGFKFTNEIKLDAKEEWLYVVETTGRCITRLRVGADGTLTQREKFGPTDLGGFPDGITFDAYGNLWGTLVMYDKLFALTPEGDMQILLDDGNRQASAQLDKHFWAGTVKPEHMAAAKGTIAPWMASVTFGGPDLRTVYLGSLGGTTLPYFQSPVAGLAMAHW